MNFLFHAGAPGRRLGRKFVGGVCQAGLLFSIALWTGCSPPKPAVAPVVPARPEWDWGRYPLTNQLRLASLACKVQPKSTLMFLSPMPGQLHLHVASAQTNLNSGFVWAEFEPQMLAIEAGSVKEARSRLVQREQTLQELELPRQKLKLTRELWEAERQEALLGWLRTNRDLAATAGGMLKGLDLRPEGWAAAQQEVGLIKRSLTALGGTNLALPGMDLEAQRADVQRRQLEFERKQEQSRLKMPFTGQLTVSLPLAEGVLDYPVSAGQELGVARDMSQIQLRVVLTDPAWASLPPQALAATVRLPTGEALTGQFAFKRIERMQMREEAVAYFTLPEAQVGQAARLAGMESAGELWLTHDQRGRVVPKFALVLHQPAAFQNRAWSEGVAQVWPGARVLAEGMTELMVGLPETELP